MSADPAIEIKQLIDLIQPAVNILYFLALFIFGLSFFSIIITLVSSMKDRKYEIVMMRVGASTDEDAFLFL